MTKYILALCLSISMIFSIGTKTVFASQIRLPSVASQAYVVMDADTGQVILEKDMDTPRAPASITKVMTIALALEMGGKYDDVITVNGKTVSAVFAQEPESSHMSLKSGEKVTFRDLVMGTQLASANDGAAVIAEYIGGTVENFVALMNQKAKELGLENTSFKNPHGLDEKGHYISPRDMAEITRYAMSVDGFAEVFGAVKYRMPKTNLQDRGYTFYATDKLVLPSDEYYYENIVGSKLGYTTNAKNTATSVAERGDMRLVCVTMAAPYRGNLLDTATLFDYCFKNYERITITAEDIRPVELPLAGVLDTEATAYLYASGEHSFLVPLGTSKNDIIVDYDVPSVINKGMEYVARFMLLHNNQILYSADLSMKEQRAIIPVGENTVPTERLSQGKVISDGILVSFYLLLTALGVSFVLYVCYRIAVVFRYSLRQRKKRRIRMELEYRKRQARARNRAQLASIREQSNKVFKTM